MAWARLVFTRGNVSANGGRVSTRSATFTSVCKPCRIRSRSAGGIGRLSLKANSPLTWILDGSASRSDRLAT